jgi:hypothetical protein
MSHHLSPETADSVSGLLESGIALLRREDAYHVAVLTHGLDSDEAERCEHDRKAARRTFRRYLDIVHAGFPIEET